MCAPACVWTGVTKIVFPASTKGFSAFLTDGPHFTLSCECGPNPMETAPGEISKGRSY